MSHLLEFYGDECPHCDRMHDLIVQVEKETGLKVDTFEVFHNKENEEKMINLGNDCCGGVPFFYNTQTKKWICGEGTHEEFKAWALGK